MDRNGHRNEGWSLQLDDQNFITSKKQSAWLDYSIKLLSYKRSGVFAKYTEVDLPTLEYIADQLLLPENLVRAPDHTAKTDRTRKREILDHLGVRRFDNQDMEKLSQAVGNNPALEKVDREALEEWIAHWSVDNQVSMPAKRQIDRLHASLRNRINLVAFNRVYSALSDDARDTLVSSIAGQRLPLSDMKNTPGQIGKNSFEKLAEKVAFIQGLKLPDFLLADYSPEWRKDVSRIVARKDPWEIKRMPRVNRVGLYSVYLKHNEPKFVDDFIDMLIDAVHKIRRTSENKVTGALKSNARKVYYNQRILKELIEAVLKRPDDAAIDVLLSVVKEKDILPLISDLKGRGGYQTDIFDRMKLKWTNYYRSMVRTLLRTVEFYSNNDGYQPVIDALNWIHVNLGVKRKFNVFRDGVPIDGVLKTKERDAIVGKDGTLDKSAYELCVLLALRDKLRCREIWVPGSAKYRNPAEDIPEDFELRRVQYYRSHGLPLNAHDFVQTLKDRMDEELRALNREFPKNRLVSIQYKPKSERYQFVITPFEASPEPENLIHLKAEIGRQWPMTDLPDMVKETALDTQFLRAFRSVGRFQHLDKTTLQQRLILCLYALGTNTGLKRISAASTQVSYDQLLHVKRRFIDSDSLRQANAIVVNAILSARDTKIWGEIGTSCASDSKQYKIWNKNPVSQMSLRHGSAGAMIYWHVDLKSACIFSYLKRMEMAEDAAMINGVLNHCTQMKIERQYTDSHGQTEAAFAFCYLLGFDLAPRIKNLSRFKLYLPESQMGDSLGHIAAMLKRPIKWDEVYREYDEMVKHTVAMTSGTSDPETILRRFRRTGINHPTYSAIMELGRAVKTIFACRYLRSEAFRREIQEGLNVMENWNSATEFVYFGRGGEISTNKREEQEVAVQSLHLLQNCMVYVNTQMFQSVLSGAEWQNRLTQEDLRAITPLIYENVNPYGRFEIDMDSRLLVS